MVASQIQHGEPRRRVMSAPTPLREDFEAYKLRGLARKTKDGPPARRLLALAAIYDGATRTEAAKIGGVGVQIIGDWVLRFNARGPDGLLDGKSTGQPSKLNDTQRQGIAHDREWPDPGGPWRGALAADRSGAMDLRGIPHHDRQADAQSGAARHGLPQTRPDRATMRKRRARLRILKKLSRAPGGNRARQGARLRHDRNLVRRRGSHRPEEQDHPSLGEARHPPKRTA